MIKRIRKLIISNRSQPEFTFEGAFSELSKYLYNRM